MRDLISQLDEASKLPFAYDESEKMYKAVQSTSHVFTSPVKKVKDLELDELNEDDNEVELNFLLKDASYMVRPGIFLEKALTLEILQTMFSWISSLFASVKK